MLRADHPLPAALRQATGVDVVTIARRYRRLLLEVDTEYGDRRRWHYQELRRHRTVLKCHTSLPDTLAAAAVGRTLSELISGGPLAGNSTITEATTSGGRLVLNLNTVWVDY
ncbi:hypothetical protein EAH87_00135 [Sphingomonas koreensis]|nr:hypothetical protein EAH87_00135 [Sphingomonas koreensis]